MANLDMVLVGIIVIATMAMFIWGKARIDVIALCALVALFVLDLIETEQVLYGLANTATVSRSAVYWSAIWYCPAAWRNRPLSSVFSRNRFPPRPT